MKELVRMLMFSLVATMSLAQEPQAPSEAPSPTIGSILDRQLALLESQLVPAAEAMPEDRYSYAPRNGVYQGVRTFALEVKHVANANLVLYSAILGQDTPLGANLIGTANGPDDLRSKDQILKYLKESFAVGHRALKTLTTENASEPLGNPPIASMKTRLELATFSLGHAWDHYGQMTEYLRMNGIIPPASIGQPWANPPR